LLGGVQENDLFQTVIMRLVEQDCAAMKRFSGNSEDGWLAYLAVISRSVVRDAVKYERRRKRPGWTDAVAVENLEDHPLSPHQEAMLPAAMERRILARELRAICDSAIPNLEREASDRNMLIFRLYFDHDLSPAQIAGCNGVNLSRAGVEKVLQRLKEHIRGLVSQASAEAILE
jgi:RNA polymerase sigma factor (sigma-70 family)